MQTSRSVTMPTTLPSPSTIGIAPQSCSHMRRAASLRLAVAPHVIGGWLINCATRIALPPKNDDGEGAPELQVTVPVRPLQGGLLALARLLFGLASRHLSLHLDADRLRLRSHLLRDRD